MDKNYSIDEILSAMNELSSLNKKKKYLNLKKTSSQASSSSVPKDTLKLIIEAENNLKQKF